MKHHHVKPLALLLACLSFAASAQTVSRIDDINTVPPVVIPTYLGVMSTPINGRVVFAGGSPLRGVELWVTDGTEANTRLVRDLNPGLGSSLPDQFVAMDAYWFFVADDGVTGRQLYRTDGTSLGTQKLSVSGNVYGLGDFSELVRVGDGLFCRARVTTTGPKYELYYSDGSVPLKATQFPTNANDTNPHSLVAWNGAVYFAGQDPAVGIEIMRVVRDSSPSGFGISAIDVKPGGAASHSNPDNLAVAQGRLYFAADFATFGHEVGFIDTAGVVTRVTDLKTAAGDGIAPGTLALFTEMGGLVYFVGAASGPQTGRELFVTDGTTAGTSLVRDIYAGPTNADPAELIAVGSTLYFAATSDAGRELWKSTGTAGITTTVRDINPAVGASGAPSMLTPFDGGLLFVADDGARGPELWRTDGSAGGTSVVNDLNPGAAGGTFSVPIRMLGDRAVFAGRNNFFASVFQLYTTDGTDAGTVRMTNGGPTSSDPRGFVRFGNAIAFAATDSVVGNELRTTDGTPGSTRLVLNASFMGFPGVSVGTGPVGAELGGWLYYSGSDFTHGFELWRTQLDAGTTAMFKKIGPDGGSSSPRDFVSSGGKVFFVADSPLGGAELFSEDGGSGPPQLLDVAPGVTSSAPTFITPFLNGVVFAAAGPSGTEPYFSDGTPAGTVLLGDLNTAGSSSPGPFVVLGDTVYFGATNPTVGRELWRSKGVVNDAVLAKELRVNAPDSKVDVLGTLNNLVIATADDGVTGSEPWAYDPVADQWRLLGNLNTAPATGSSPRSLVTFKGRGYFIATSTKEGSEVFRTDGTAASTRVHFDLRPGSTGSAPHDLFAGASVLAFWANDGIHGDEVWVTDDNESNTQLVGDINPGPANATPLLSAPFAELNNHIVFAATGPDDDVEPYAIELDNTPPTITPRPYGTAGKNGWFVLGEARLSWELPSMPHTTPISGCESRRYTEDGIYNEHCTASALGRTASVDYTLKLDTTPPVAAACPSIEQEAAGATGAFVEDRSFTVSDNLSAVTQKKVPQLGALFPLGVTPVDLLLEDEAGNRSVCQFEVRVRDTRAPVITCPTAPIEARQGAPVDPAIPVAEDVDATPTFTYSPPLSANLGLGLHQTSLIVTDSSNNKSAECQFQLNIIPRDDTGSGGGGGAPPPPHSCLGCTATDAAGFPLIALLFAALGRRRRTGLALPLLGVAALVQSCVFDPTLKWTPPCGPNGECPKSTTCQTTNWTCVANDAVDNTRSELSSKSLRIIGGSKNRLTNPTALNHDSRAEIQIGLSKPLSKNPTITTVPALFCAPQAPGTGQYSWFCEFPLEVDAGRPPDGKVALTVDVEDISHNTNTFDLSDLNLVIDDTPPAAPDTLTPGTVVYHRAPWGSADAVASNGLPQPTFTLSGHAGAATGALEVVVFSDKGELGSGRVTANGAFLDDIKLQPYDATTVDVIAVDGAGNESPRAMVHDVEWVVTQSGMSSPHLFSTYAASSPSLVRPGDLESSAAGGLELPGDGKLQHVEGGASWKQRSFDAPSNTSAGYSFDTSRGQLVRYGGSGSSGFLGTASVEDMWEANGNEWFQRRPPSRPHARQFPSMAFDSIGHRTLLFGGFDGITAYNDTWFWDGENWKTSAATGPSGRWRSALAYSPLQRRFVLFGGRSPAGTALGDTWTFESERWQALDAGGPSPRYAAATTYDAIHDAVLLFGGRASSGTVLNDLWSFTASGWAQLTPDGGTTPEARAGAALTFDNDTQKAFLLGGERADAGGIGDLWEWSNGAWTRRATPPLPGARLAYPTFVFRPAAAEHALYDTAPDGGGSIWTWDDFAWTPARQYANATGVRPSGRSSLAYVSSSQRMVTLAANGASQMLVELTNDGWVDLRQPLGSRPRVEAQSIAYDAVQDRVVLVRAQPISLAEAALWLFGAPPPIKTAETWLVAVDGGPNPWEQQLDVDGGAGEHVSLEPQIVRQANPQATTGISMDGPTLAVSPFGVMNFLGRGVDFTRISSGLNVAVDGPTRTRKLEGGVWSEGPSIPDNLLFPVAASLQDGGVLVAGSVLRCDGGDCSDLRVKTFVVTSSSATEVSTTFTHGAPSFVFDPRRGRLLSFGGYSLNIESQNELLEFDVASGNWLTVRQSDPEGDDSAPPREQAGFAYDAVRGVDVLIAGRQTPTIGAPTPLHKLTQEVSLDDTWELHYADARPSGVFKVALNAAQMPATAIPRRLVVTTMARGSGEKNGAAARGFELALWSNGHWSYQRRVPPADGGTGVHGATLTLLEAAQLQPLISGQNALSVRLQPMGVNGGGTAALDVDYVEARILYRLP